MMVQSSSILLPCNIPQQGHFHTLNVVGPKIPCCSDIISSIYLLYLQCHSDSTFEDTINEYKSREQ